MELRRQPRLGRIDSEHIQILQRRYSLLKDLNPSDVTDRLLEANIINFEDNDDIRVKLTIREKRDVLIEKIRYSGENSFYSFLLILTETGYKHIAEEFEKELSEKSSREYIEFKNRGTKPKIQTPVEHETEPVSGGHKNNELEDSSKELYIIKPGYDNGKTDTVVKTVCETAEDSGTKKSLDVSDCRSYDSNSSDVYSVTPIEYQNTSNSDEHVYTPLRRATTQGDAQHGDTQRDDTQQGDTQHHYTQQGDTQDYNQEAYTQEDLTEQDYTPEHQQDEPLYDEVYSETEKLTHDYENTSETCSDNNALPTPCQPGVYNNIPVSYANLENQINPQAETTEVKQRSKKSKSSKNKRHDLNSDSVVTPDIPSGRASTTGYQDHRPSEIRLVQPLYLRGYKKPSNDTTTLEFYNRELKNIDGWYAGITEDNFGDIVEDNRDKIGHYFIWYSEVKDAVIVTIIQSPEEQHVRVKTRGQRYYFRRDEQFDTVKDLIVHITHNALIKI